jgi:F-type H+-transporting ATPase subunit b
VPVLQIIQIFGETASHGAEEAHGIAALGLDPWAILAQAGTFLVLFWVIKKFALTKIVNTLEERRQTIDKGVRLGYEMADEREKLQQKIEDELRKTREKADQIIAEAHKEAGITLKDAEASAAAKVDTMLEDARARITEDMQKAKNELEKDMRHLVADATEIIIGEKLDAKKDDALIKRALSGVK